VDEQLLVATREDDGAVLVTVGGELDMSSAGQLAGCLEQLGGAVVVDLSEATFCDSSGLNSLFHAWRRLNGDGGSLVVRNPRPHLRRVFEIAGLDHLLERDG
jgi:anti-anti-sigma factor